jgi:SAM-dependent methyltransferase
MDKDYWDKVWSLQVPYLNTNNKLVPGLPWDIKSEDRNLNFIISTIQPNTVLEIGCGSGSDAIFMAKNNIRVTAIDISEKAISIAKQKVDAPLVNFMCEDFLLFNKEEKFHMVFDRGFIHTQKKILLDTIFNKVYNCCTDKGYYVIICGSYKDDNNIAPGTNPTMMSLGTIEHMSAPYFKIKFAQEVVLELNDNFLDKVGWLLILQKRNIIDKSIHKKMQGNSQ